MKMKTLGICCGASTISAVCMTREGEVARVVKVVSKPHDGNPKQVVAELLSAMDIASCDRIASTGRKLRQLLNLTSISEPLAVEHAVAHIRDRYPETNAVVSAGGETFIAYGLDRDGRIGKVYTGNKCASGTGEFFLQQIRRMDVGIDEAIRFARSEKPHHVSGRCSVFCKSDCTHATNNGVPKGQVVAGLCRMMSGKILELLSYLPKQDIIIVGGTTQNDVMIEYLKEEIDGLAVPHEATYFEAMGAALWAGGNTTKPVDLAHLFAEKRSQFEYHPPLRDFAPHVTFAEMERGKAADGDRCILGLDVGSTTTKAVIIRETDRKILASEYLRTNGDPVGASQRCYRALYEQVAGSAIMIEGLGVTGSGRNIAGLHALTDGVINEIIAHATAAIHFDQDVDTIFEIGGQDAKYTYITNGVASDYAMNEACSAGTGSFLEESAKETLGIEMEDIADLAMQGTKPPNFNDQCAAFIASDIKNAFHEGVSKADTVAGLVYSICMNYVNRVKGSRPVGGKVFMQGGVCYNRAVPIAMAALSGKEIIVPPEPGLMGAYGVALEVQDRIEKGLLERAAFSLETLLARTVEYREPFTCAGGAEKCDIGCAISRIALEGKVYPFGGACNRYYNLRHHVEVDAGRHDLVALREKMVFEDYAADAADLPADAPVVGINRSFMTATLYPLYSHFFKGIGYRTVLPDCIDPEGVNARTAAFCFPFEISHGYFFNLLEKKPDRIFLPHIHGIEVENGYSSSTVCPMVQGEPFVLNSTFETRIGNTPVHQPFFQFDKGRDVVRNQFITLGKELGASLEQAERAFDNAWRVQKEMEAAMLKRGRAVLDELEADPKRIGIVLFGRPYNAFSHEANKGIPHKFASRGCTVIPMDFLDVNEVSLTARMYWSMGQIILKGAELVKAHPQLFGTYITNFSCGPDSFIIGFFRNVLGTKPSLTLELDNHTADAGLETRIEAFLDIVARYRAMEQRETEEQFDAIARSNLVDKQFIITTSEGEKVDLKDPRVKLVFPSMSQWSSRGIAAACSSVEVQAEALPAMCEEDLKTGKGNTLCKECLPLQLTTGALLRYLERRDENEVTVYFMPTTEGPCRLGQYQEFMKSLIRKRKIRNVTFLSLSSDDGYAGLGTEFVLLCWYASVVADSFHNIHNLMLVNAVDPDDATVQLDAMFGRVLEGLTEGGWPGLRRTLKQAAADLAEIPMKTAPDQVPTILLLGEIYVRAEGLARRWLPEYLAKQGLATHMVPLYEWVNYAHHEYGHQRNQYPTTRIDRFTNRIKWKVMIHAEKDVNSILAKSGWYVPRPVDVEHVVAVGSRLLTPNLFGEAILTIGGALAEIGTDFCGSIAIGPFGCMPNRICESILNNNVDREHLSRFRKDQESNRVFAEMEMMPFLAIESDGSPFPQVIEARLETFVLQAKRLHGIMAEPQVQRCMRKKEKPPAMAAHAFPALSRALRLAANPALAQRAARIRAASG
jgi:predicted CoA-substrate-specific enzyme activase